MSDSEFVKNIQKWVAIDTQLRELNEKTKKFREMRKEVADTIHKHVEENQMQKTVININDGDLRFVDKKEYQSLTLGYIEQCLNKCLQNDLRQVAIIMQEIRGNRGIKVVKDISRNYKEKTEK
jgi:broad specificity polyphosphatase/5'/3'-nucleotidase SurE